jgi:hypothetical protein
MTGISISAAMAIAGIRDLQIRLVNRLFSSLKLMTDGDMLKETIGFFTKINQVDEKGAQDYESLRPGQNYQYNG